MSNGFRLLALAVAGMALAGCGGSGSGGGSAGADGTGTVSLAATDAPVDDAMEVNVTFDAVALKPAGGPMETFEFDEPATINLLDFTGEDSSLILDDTTVPAGEYEFLRLFVAPGADNGSSVVTSEGTFDLFIPGQQNRPDQSQGAPRFVQLNTGEGELVVPNGGDANFTIDFDLRTGLTGPLSNGPQPEDFYLLRPALRLINNVNVDTIQGNVAMELTMREGCGDAQVGNQVYLYEGADAVAGDVNVTESTGTEDDPPEPDHADTDTDGNSDEVNPITTATVSEQDDDGMLDFTIGFVAEGEYTIAFTCMANEDMPETDEAIVFDPVANVTVTADGNPEEVNFESDGGVTVNGEIVVDGGGSGSAETTTEN